LRSKNSN
jgi:hypothetical protein